jgi:signal transduction histidine kinase
VFPKSLRSRLIVSFAVLVFLSLFLAGTMTVFLLKKEQERTAQEKVGLLAEPITLRAAFLEASGATPAEIVADLESIYSVRILLIDQDRVVGDSGLSLRGEQLSAFAESGVAAAALPDPRRFRVSRYGPERLLLFTSRQGLVAAIPGPAGTVLLPRYQAVIAIPESDVREAWRALLPRFLIAGGIALGVAVIAAGLLARSISRPLQRITAASEQIAQGRYDQEIEAQGGDEVVRLSQAFNNMAREVSRSHRTLREFLANVSHELKTPLTSIQGFSQAISEGAVREREDIAEAGRIINEESVRMRALVDDLLYLSQVEAGQIEIQRDEVRTADLLESTRERFQRRADQAGVTMTIAADETPLIQADARRLEQAVSNIVDNAVRHTPSGGRITLRSQAENGHLEIAVHNTGSAIPAAALPRLFDRFFQVNPGQASIDGSSGLGLAITKEIVELHGGEVRVSSSEAAGTEFVISLPVNQAPPNGTA